MVSVQHNKINLLENAIATFPFLAKLNSSMQERFCQHAQLMNVPAGQFVCLEGETCTHLVLVLAGSARIYKTGESGREITLYRIDPGESCIITASCILSQQKFPAFAITETEVEAIGLPAQALQEWMTYDSLWQQYVFGLLSQRLATVMEVVEEVAFHRMDSRIASYLLSIAPPDSPELHITHEAIALELGSSREVISRLLKDMERKTIVRLSRGAIRILNPTALAEIAQ